MIAIMLMVVIIGCFGFLSNPYLNTVGTDSAIFLYISKMMNNGCVPYRDLFDHKGPLIYFIDALSLSISSSSFIGLWIFDSLIYLLFFLLAYCFCRRYVDVESTVYSLVIAAAIYHLVVCGGNMPEMYIAFFAILAYLYCVRFVVWSAHACIVMGFCVGCIVFLKFNMITVAVPIFIYWVMRSRRIYNLLFLVVGFALATLPVALYFHYNSSLHCLWDVYVEYNRLYAGTPNLLPKLNRAFFAVLPFFVYNIYLCFDKNLENKLRFVVRLNMVYFFVAWYIIILSSGTYRYYGPVLPAMMLPMAFFVNRYKSIARVTACGAAFILIAIVLQRNICHDDTSRREALASLKQHMPVNSRIQVLGCDCLAYFYLNAECPTRFPYQGTVACVSAEYRQQMIDDINNKVFDFLIVPDGVLETVGPLGVTWAKSAIFDNYTIVEKKGCYRLYRRN